MTMAVKRAKRKQLGSRCLSPRAKTKRSAILDSHLPQQQQQQHASCDISRFEVPPPLSLRVFDLAPRQIREICVGRQFSWVGDDFYSPPTPTAERERGGRTKPKTFKSSSNQANFALLRAPVTIPPRHRRHRAGKSLPRRRP